MAEDRCDVVEGNRAARRPIRIGAISADEVEIADGLHAGEAVVVAGVRNVSRAEISPCSVGLVSAGSSSTHLRRTDPHLNHARASHMGVAVYLGVINKYVHLLNRYFAAHVVA